MECIKIGCTRKPSGGYRGYCQTCYRRGRKDGTIPLVIGALSEEERFWDKVDTSGEDCWPWVAGKDASGYGSFRLTSEKTVRAHRHSYELLVGPIPPGLDLDHLCRNRHCVNPGHLEPVTRVENIMRGYQHRWRTGERKAPNPLRTHCMNGHEYTPENFRIMPNGHRSCQTCAAAHALRSGWIMRSEPGSPKRRAAEATHCVNGHEYTPENTYTPPLSSGGGRVCRACIRKRSADYAARKRLNSTKEPA